MGCLPRGKPTTSFWCGMHKFDIWSGCCNSVLTLTFWGENEKKSHSVSGTRFVRAGFLRWHDREFPFFCPGCRYMSPSIEAICTEQIHIKNAVTRRRRWWYLLESQLRRPGLVRRIYRDITYALEYICSAISDDALGLPWRLAAISWPLLKLYAYLTDNSVIVNLW